MRKLCIDRQNQSALRKKAKWALYEEKYFKRLIEDIKELVDELSELFPAMKQEQLKLCEVEVSEIGIDGASALIDIAKSQDKDLEAAIIAALRAAVSTPGPRIAISATDSDEERQAQHNIQQQG